MMESFVLCLYIDCSTSSASSYRSTAMVTDEDKKNKIDQSDRVFSSSWLAILSDHSSQHYPELGMNKDQKGVETSYMHSLTGYTPFVLVDTKVASS